MSAVLAEVEAGVGRIVLNRPAASNAFDLGAVEALRAAIDAVDHDEVGVVTLEGAGRRFCAGGDVRSILAASHRPAYLRELAEDLEEQVRRLADLAKPVVAGVHGAVAGAGLAFVLSADLVVAARSTKFVMAYSGIGLTPDCGVSFLLPTVVGVRRALELALTDRVLTAEEALEWGLVTEVVADNDLGDRVCELADRLVNGPIGALGQSKRLIRTSGVAGREANARDEVATIVAALAGSEASRLLEAFAAR